MPTISAAVFDLVDRIAAADTVSGVWDAYLGAAHDVGLDYGLALYMPLANQEEIQVVADALPAHCLEDYREQGLGDGDLLIERIRHSDISFEWTLDDWDIADLTPIQRRWRDHNVQRGIQGGLSILDFRRGEGMVLVACGSDGQMHVHDRLALIFAGQEAMLRLRELCVAAPMTYSPLSRREQECLQWAAAGKTDWEIGRILSLSEKTINVYVERAKAKYGVKTRAQAIVAALRAGAIAA